MRNIREFYFQSGKIRGILEIFQNIKENQRIFKFLIVSFLSSDFLCTQPCIQLSLIVAKFYPMYDSVLCSHFEVQFRFALKPKF